MAKKCPKGEYYCFTDKKCKKIPRGYYIGARGYLARGDNRSDSGNGNGNGNGSSNGNGNGGNGAGNGNGGSGGNGGGNGGGGMGESLVYEKLDSNDKPFVKKLVGKLRKGSKTHAKQADDLEKAMTESSNPRIPRKKGQPAKSKKHSDLYTDEDPKGTIHGLGFKDVAKAKASVSKIRNSSRSHAHKIQAAVAMEQRAREMGKTSEAAVYRKYINAMKKKTKKMNEAANPAQQAAIAIDMKKKGKKPKNIQEMPKDIQNTLKGGLSSARDQFLQKGKVDVKGTVKNTIKNVLQTKSVSNFLNKNSYEPQGKLVERTMTSSEKRKDTMLKKKYDKSDMKKSMQKQYGKEEGKKVYFATIRKQAMEGVTAIPTAINIGSKALPAIAAGVGAVGTMMQAKRKYKTRNNPTGRVGIEKKDKRIVGSGEKAIFDRQTKETTYDGSPKIRATNREIDKQKKLVDRYAKKYKTPKEKAADLQRSRLARRGEYMEDDYNYNVSEEGLRDWFGKSSGTTKSGRKVRGWVQVGGKYDGKPCARQPGQKSTPKCVSSAKRRSMSKSERDSAARRKRAADPNQPQKSGAAKPTNVSTDPKKKMKEQFENGKTFSQFRSQLNEIDQKGLGFKALNTALNVAKFAKNRIGSLFTKKPPKIDAGTFQKVQNKSMLNKAKKYSQGEYPKIGGGNRPTLNTSKGDTPVKTEVSDTMKRGIDKMFKDTKNPIKKVKKNINKDPFEGDTTPKNLNNEFVIEAKDKKGKGSGTKDACYHKVKSRYSVWPSAYASGALVKCRKVGAANWGNKTKKEGFSPMQVAALEAAGMIELNEAGKKCWKGYEKKGTQTLFGKTYNRCVKKKSTKESVEFDEGIMDTVKDVGKKVIKKTKEFINKPIIAPTINQKDYQQRVKDKTTHKLVGEGSSYGITRGSGVPSGQMAAFGKKKKDKDKKKAQVEEGITFLKRKKKESSSEYTRERDAGKEAKKLMKKKDQEKVNFLEPEETNESKTRLIKNGHTYRVVLTWRGKTYMVQMFVPSVSRPTRQQIEKEVQKLYPDAKVMSFLPRNLEPGEPTVMMGEDVERDEYGDPVGGPKISKKEKKKNLAKNEKDEDHTTTTAEQYVTEDDMKGMSVKSGHKRPTKSGAGMTQKGVEAYRRRNPGSKLKTAVTGKVKKGSKDAKRRKSYCARSAGQMKKFPKAAKDPNSRLRQARRRWKC